MERLEFEDYEEFACDIADKYNSFKGEDYEDVAIIAKYECTRQIIKELLCLGYNIHSIEMHDEEWDGYEAEYICSIYNDEIWCEPMLRENGYLTDDSHIMYVMDNCSSAIIPYCKGEIIYEVSVGDTDEVEEMIRSTEKNLNRHVSDMFDMLYRPYLYEYHPYPIEFYWKYGV